MIRTITHSDYLANMTELSVKLCVLKLNDIIAYKSYLLAFKASNNMLPLISSLCCCCVQPLLS